MDNLAISAFETAVACVFRSHKWKCELPLKCGIFLLLLTISDIALVVLHCMKSCISVINEVIP